MSQPDAARTWAEAARSFELKGAMQRLSGPERTDALAEALQRHVRMRLGARRPARDRLRRQLAEDAERTLQRFLLRNQERSSPLPKPWRLLGD